MEESDKITYETMLLKSQSSYSRSSFAADDSMNVNNTHVTAKLRLKMQYLKDESERINELLEGI